MSRSRAVPPVPADDAYERVRTICLGFPGTGEKLSHGTPSFHVGGRMFLMFVDDHHGDGRLAVWCKSTLDEQKRLVAGNPERFFVPPYVGVKGWVGVSVDPRHADFIELAMLVEEGWRSIAPRRVASGATASSASRSPRPARLRTDERVAHRALDRMTELGSALPGTECEREGKHATFRVRGKVFAYFLDNHHGDGRIAACVRGDREEHALLVEKDPKRFFLPAYIGPRGYLGVRLDDAGEAQWKEVARRMAAAHASVASPKKAVASRRRR